MNLAFSDPVEQSFAGCSEDQVANKQFACAFGSSSKKQINSYGYRSEWSHQELDKKNTDCDRLSECCRTQERLGEDMTESR